MFQAVIKKLEICSCLQIQDLETNRVNSSVGTIDYEKGEINLKQIQITSTVKTFDGDPIIEISACPLSNDVVGKQDLYLQLDINNTTLNMAIDDVSSGADVSASLYSPITSYTNGIRVRR